MLIEVLKQPYNSLLILSQLTFESRYSLRHYSYLRTLIIESSMIKPNLAQNQNTLNILKGSSVKVFSGSRGVLIIFYSKSLIPLFVKSSISCLLIL